VNADTAGVHVAPSLDGSDVNANNRARDQALSAGLSEVNSFVQPTNVAPVTKRVSGLGNRFVYDFPANAVTFIRLTRR
jgi:alpha-L-arabinofuranosidase